MVKVLRPKQFGYAEGLLDLLHDCITIVQRIVTKQAKEMLGKTYRLFHPKMTVRDFPQTATHAARALRESRGRNQNVPARVTEGKLIGEP